MTLLEIKEISFSMPQRKKYDQCFTKNYQYVRAPKTTELDFGMADDRHEQLRMDWEEREAEERGAEERRAKKRKTEDREAEERGALDSLKELVTSDRPNITFTLPLLQLTMPLIL